MKGITEERLKEKLHIIDNSIHLHREHNLIVSLLKECTELSPQWQPIDENVIEDKNYLVMFEDGSMEVARLVADTWLNNDNLDFDYGNSKPIKYCELQEDPK